ncbi:hypothetical protein MHU86_1816 [Fragilaria crotonensis]|nr:hypothetical protein MHU86_1816 [Fragilaria crotonensis]
MSLLQRVRDNGSCPPTLLGDERNVGDVAFDALISRILDLAAPNSISLGSEPHVADDFQELLEYSCTAADQCDATEIITVLGFSCIPTVAHFN